LGTAAVGDDATLACTLGVTREDSGVIDLFALNERAKQAAAAGPVVPDPLSAPPPAFTTNLHPDVDLAGSAAFDDDELDNPFAKKPRNKIALIGAGAAATLLVLGLVIASVSGSSPSDTSKASAAGRPEPKTEPAAPPPLVAPVVIAPPSPVVAPVAAASVPAPPATGAGATSKAAPRAARPGASGPSSKPRATTAGGVKLTKVQSAGVP
jgi:hypothetical protein